MGSVQDAVLVLDVTVVLDVDFGEDSSLCTSLYRSIPERNIPNSDIK